MADENVPPVTPPPESPPPVTPPPVTPPPATTPPSGAGTPSATPPPAAGATRAAPRKKSKKWIIGLVAVVLLLCCLCSAAGGALFYFSAKTKTDTGTVPSNGTAGETGSITGRVGWERQDDSVIYMEGATVVLTGPSDASQKYQATTESTGRYTIEAVKVGTYEVKCIILKTKKGQVDKSWHIKGVVISPNNATIQDLTFQNSDDTFNPN